MWTEMAIVAGARHLAQGAQALDVDVLHEKALRLNDGHFLDDRVEVGAPPLRLVASHSRKASRKKSRSACLRPIIRSGSAIRALAFGSSSALPAAEGPASMDAGSDDAGNAAGGGRHPTFRPR